MKKTQKERLGTHLPPVTVTQAYCVNQEEKENTNY